MSLNEINITGQDGDYLLIADPAKGYKGRIHKSLIEANEIEVVDEKFCASDNLYNAWFEEDIYETNKKNEIELSNYFFQNIPLFIQKQEIILKEPRLYSIVSPRCFYMAMYTGGMRATLGEMLLLWENDQDFHGQCECGGKYIVLCFGGSPLSGSGNYSCFCLKCKNVFRKGGCFGKFQKVKGIYHPFTKYSKEAVTLKDLVAILEGKMDIKDAEVKDYLNEYGK